MSFVRTMNGAEIDPDPGDHGYALPPSLGVVFPAQSDHGYALPPGDEAPQDHVDHSYAGGDYAAPLALSNTETQVYRHYP